MIYTLQQHPVLLSNCPSQQEFHEQEVQTRHRFTTAMNTNHFSQELPATEFVI